MDYTIARRLKGLLRRLRLFHMLWSLALVWVLFALLGFWLWNKGKQGDGVPAAMAQAWLISGLATTILCVWLAWRSIKNVNGVARIVENRYPQLNQRLITATELRPARADGNFTFLQRSVIDEALNHDVKNQWLSIVPTKRLIALAVANIPGLLAVCGVGWALWSSPKVSLSPLITEASAPSQILPPEVVPGNTEVKKGSSLIVTAKFPGKVPSQVWLVRQSLASTEIAGESSENNSNSSSASEDKLLMKRSLGDPLFAAFLNDIREPMEYRIEYESDASPKYSVTVFECPEVVRVDAQLSYPLYTQLDAKEVVDTRRVSAPIGSTLTWLVHLTKPIVKGALIAKADGQPLELTQDSSDPLLVRCEIQVAKTGEWQVQLTDADGRQNEIAVSLKLNALANKEPVLQLTSGGDAIVSALQEFEVAAKINDDYVVTSAGIGYQLAGGELIERPLEIKLASEKSKKESTVADIIDFESLKAEPEQLLSYYLWAEDLDEQGEPRRVTSDIYFVEVRPFEEIFRQGDPSADQQQQQQNQQSQGQQQGQEGEELLEMQKQIISATWNIARSASSKGLPPKAGDDLEVVLDSQEQALQMLQEQAAEAPPEAEAAIAQAGSAMSQAAEKLASASKSLSKSELAQAISAEQQAYQSLLKLQTRENQVSRQRSQSSSQQQSRRQQNRQQQLDQLELEERENRYQDERRAQEEEKSPESETRQIASRLRELAMRQQDLNQQLRDVEAALQAAETKEQREELEQRLERLRQQQQQILEDADELQQQMQENQSSEMQEAQQQMEQTRENLQQANQSLRENNTGQALAAGARAQEELEQLREEVREQAANQFGESMQEMRSSAEQLQQRQQELVDQLKPQEEKPSTGLRDSQQGQNAQAAELTKEQQQELSELLERMQKTIERAEESEPLLAQKLFDGYRRTQEERLEDQLELTKRLVEKEFNQDAGELATGTLEDLKTLGKEIGEAAESVLGSDLESMRLALDQLDAARQQVEGELARETGSQTGDPNSESNQSRETNSEQRNDPNRANDPSQREGNAQERNTEQQQGQQPGQQQEQQEVQQAGQQQGRQPGQQQGEQPGPQQSQQEGQQPGQQSGQQQGQQQGQAGQQRSGQSQQQAGQPGLRDDSASEPGELANDESRPGLLGGGGGVDRDFRNASPIAGEDFRNWSDRLRDVEELVTDPELRWEATRIRQAARDLRSDWQRNSKAPRWSDVEDMVAAPLRDLQRKVSQELMRRAAEKTDIVPVDRDPVPAQYQNLVREYYERLGKGK